MKEGITPENIHHYDGKSVPTIPEALKSDEKLAEFATELGGILQERPDDKRKLIAALDAAEKYLDLESGDLGMKEVSKLGLQCAVNSAMGALILAVLIPQSAPLTLPIAATGASTLFLLNAHDRELFKKDARRRLRLVRATLSA